MESKGVPSESAPGFVLLTYVEYIYIDYNRLVKIVQITLSL